MKQFRKPISESSKQLQIALPVRRLISRIGCVAILSGACFVMGLPVQAKSNGSDSSTSPLHVFPLIDPSVPEIEGTLSTIVRTDFGVTMRVRTKDLPPGDAFTFWMVVFNYPEYCENDPCDAGPGGDLDIPEVAGDVMYVAGNVIGSSGRASFAGHKMIGDNSGSILVPLLPDGIEPPGLQNPRGAEIHLVVHTHGPMSPAYMPEQIQTFGGGCVDPGFPFESIHFPEWGLKGGEMNICLSLQFAIHK